MTATPDIVITDRDTERRVRDGRARRIGFLTVDFQPETAGRYDL